MLFFQSDTSVLFMIYDMWYDSDMYLYVEADLIVLWPDKHHVHVNNLSHFMLKCLIVHIIFNLSDVNV